MHKVNWFFLSQTIYYLLRKHSDNLSTTLKSPKLCAAQAQSKGEETVIITLEKLRVNNLFLLFWKNKFKHLDTDERALSRKEKASRRIKENYSRSLNDFS